MKVVKNILTIIGCLLLVSITYSFVGERQKNRPSEILPEQSPSLEEIPIGESEISPMPENNVTSGILTTKLDQGASSNGIVIVPKAVLEDSRCAANVNCIWAGRVRLQALVVVGTKVVQEEFVLGESRIIEEKSITFSAVRPQAVTGVTISKSDYEFDFSVR